MSIGLQPCRLRRGRLALTLVELMVSLSVLGVLVGVLAGIFNSVSRSWTYSTARIGEFREAREAFESMNRRLREATLNTYLDYLDSNGLSRTPATAATFVPVRYGRASELRFLAGPASDMGLPQTTGSHAVFFAVPNGYTNNSATFSGLDSLLNTWGYYVEWNDDLSVPAFLTPQRPRLRYRLMEFQQPSEQISVFAHTQANSAYTGKDWFLDAFKNQPVPSRVLAENIVALIIQPKLASADEKQLRDSGVIGGGVPPGTALAPNYLYDSTLGSNVPALNSRHQLPPVLSVTLVAVDERELARLPNSELPLQTDLASRFRKAGDHAADLAWLTETLRAQGVVCRVFSTELRINAAKWSREQKN
jgi:uncharacterized protein (TIGR02599 family)